MLLNPARVRDEVAISSIVHCGGEWRTPVIAGDVRMRRVASEKPTSCY
jgi:hypothetical protein